MEDIFYFIILCFYLLYRHLCFNTNVFFYVPFFEAVGCCFFCRLFTQDTILKIIFIVEKFFVLSGWKTWCFNTDRTATECYGVFEMHSLWRGGTGVSGEMEKIGKNCEYWCHCHCIGLKVKIKVALSRIYWFCLAHRVLVLH